MRILVAGAAGFLGSHLVRRLLAEGCQVAILTRADSSMWRIADILPSVRVMQSDLLNLTGVGETLREFAPQVVVHLAWQGGDSEFAGTGTSSWMHELGGSGFTGRVRGVESCDKRRNSHYSHDVVRGNQAVCVFPDPAILHAGRNALCMAATLFGLWTGR